MYHAVAFEVVYLHRTSPNIHTDVAIAAETVIAGLRLVHISCASLVFLLKELESGTSTRYLVVAQTKAMSASTYMSIATERLTVRSQRAAIASRFHTWPHVRTQYIQDIRSVSANDRIGAAILRVR